jgi:hypothetical protein
VVDSTRQKEQLAVQETRKKAAEAAQKVQLAFKQNIEKMRSDAAVVQKQAEMDILATQAKTKASIDSIQQQTAMILEKLRLKSDSTRLEWSKRVAEAKSLGEKRKKEIADEVAQNMLAAKNQEKAILDLNLKEITDAKQRAVAEMVKMRELIVTNIGNLKAQQAKIEQEVAESIAQNRQSAADSTHQIALAEAKKVAMIREQAAKSIEKSNAEAAQARQNSAELIGKSIRYAETEIKSIEDQQVAAVKELEDNHKKKEAELQSALANLIQTKTLEMDSVRAANLRNMAELQKSNEIKQQKYDTETAEARQKAQAGIAAAQKEASDLIYQAKQAADAQIQQVKAETALEIAKMKAEAKKVADELRKQ